MNETELKLFWNNLDIYTRLHEKTVARDVRILNMNANDKSTAQIVQAIPCKKWTISNTFSRVRRFLDWELPGSEHNYFGLIAMSNAILCGKKTLRRNPHKLYLMCIEH